MDASVQPVTPDMPGLDGLAGLPEPRLLRLLRCRWLLLLPLLYIAAQFASVWFGTAGLFERDGYYHARFANLLPSFGLSRDFHWTQLSTWHGQFCDKEFLFHVLMIPFTFDSAEPVLGAKVFALLLGVGVFAALYFVLRRHAVRMPVFFALLPLGFGAAFLMRVLMIRSHVLSIILLLIGVHFMLRKSWKAVGVMGFIYAWSYTFPLLLVMTALPFCAGRWFGGGRFDWKIPTAAFAGVMAGLVLHPYSPYTLETFLTYLQVVWQGAGDPAHGIELGHEIYSMSAREMLLQLPLFCSLWIALLLGAFRTEKRLSPDAMALLFAALFWTGMTMMYARFIEYSAPLLALCAGFAVRDLLAGIELRELFARYRRQAAAGALGAVLLLAGGHAATMADVHRMTANLPPPVYRGAKQWMEQNLQPGDVVAHLWWEDFRDLYYDCYRQNFIWGLDPTYTVRKDPQAAHILELMRTRQAPINPHWIREHLNARVLAMLQGNAVQHPELASAGWHPVYADRFAVLFALEGPHGPPETLAPNPRARPLAAFPPCSLPLYPSAAKP